MQDLGKFKGCAYAKFDYDPYKTYWVYIGYLVSARRFSVGCYTGVYYILIA